MLRNSNWMGAGRLAPFCCMGILCISLCEFFFRYAARHARMGLNIFFLSRVACVLVLNNLMLVVSPPSGAYQPQYWHHTSTSSARRGFLFWALRQFLSYPWFTFYTLLILIPSYPISCVVRPFHATLGIATCRMLIHLRKFAFENLEGGPEGRIPLPNLEVDPHADVVRWNLATFSINIHVGSGPSSRGKEVAGACHTRERK